jgi:hypothetical protein
VHPEFKLQYWGGEVPSPDLDTIRVRVPTTLWLLVQLDLGNAEIKVGPALRKEPK